MVFAVRLKVKTFHRLKQLRLLYTGQKPKIISTRPIDSHIKKAYKYVQKLRLLYTILNYFVAASSEKKTRSCGGI
jgi:hypothetical protein